ncbi:sensor domain-containing protein [Peribacillus glennii]|nr:EAL domain-containing protein [Peribacillus glennii]
MINKLSKNNDNSVFQLAFYQSTFHTLIEKAPVGIYILEEGQFAYVNQFYSNLLGYQKQEISEIELSLEQIIYPEDLSILKNHIKKTALREDVVAEYRVRQIKKDGTILLTEMNISTSEINGKQIFFGTVMDISKQVAFQQQIEEANERHRSLFENSPDAIFSFDHEGQFLSANPATELLAGYSAQELEQMSFRSIVATEDLPMAMKSFEQGKQGISSNYKIQAVRKDGGKIHIDTIHFPMRVNGEIIGTYGVARDITNKIKYDQQLEKLAFYDPLTELPNRKLFEDRVGQLLNFLHNEQREFAVVYLDLDRFKFINNSLGRQNGDEFLKLVATRLKKNMEKTDTLSRMAGDEFTILLPDATKEEAIKTAINVNEAITEPFQIAGNLITVSASIGIALGTDSKVTVDEIIRNAETAMRYTKKFKKNIYTLYSEELDAKASYRLSIENDLKVAIQNDELELFYQPIIDLNTNQLKAMEALIRWNHREHGLISPNDFIPIAEESGQIIEIGSWVLKTACRQNKKWQDSGILPFKVAVNVSTKQLQHYNFIHSVAKTLEEEMLEPKWLELEVTESILHEDVEFIKENLLRLKELGVCLSIDDFGTGYTSLNYLREYPFDKIKIDRSFIDDINRDLNGKRITSAVISLAHSLNMNVVAEGIENETQLNYLSDERCDEGQGYFFNRPLPVNRLKFN